MLDSLRGLDEILQYGAGEDRLAEMNRRTDDLAKTEERMKKNAGRNTACTNAVIYLFDLAMLVLAAGLYLAGEVDFAGLLIPVLALFSSFGAGGRAGGSGKHTAEHLRGGQPGCWIFSTRSRRRRRSAERRRVTFDGAEARHVTFSYGQEEILTDLSLSVPPRGIVGIVGKSGSGKSTLLKLFMRFWETERGSIEISGRSVNEINTDNLRRMESYVTQDTHLFHDSIFNNLRIAKLDATRKEVEEACRKASVHDFIMSLPRGYDTPVGELGDTLSGGERQRLGLARAFLHEASFVLLDEPTSNLDSLNEAVILQSPAQGSGAGKLWCWCPTASPPCG